MEYSQWELLEKDKTEDQLATSMQFVIQTAGLLDLLVNVLNA